MVVDHGESLKTVGSKAELDCITSTSTINFINLRPIYDIRDTVNVQTYIQKGMIHSANWLKM